LHHEIQILRHQLNVLRRAAPKRVSLTNVDRWLFVSSYRVWPGVLGAVQILRPETIVRWHRQGFRAYWHRRSRGLAGRPRTPKEITDLIRKISLANPRWGAPRIHGEILKLAIDVAPSTVAKYMATHRRPPSPSWRTFLTNHADGIASIDLFVVPTVTFKLLYGFVVLRHGRRQLLAVAVTAHPAAEWLARQMSEAFPWDSASHYLIRDRDGSYGQPFTRRIRAMGIRDRPIAPRCPRQNACAERAIGSIRRECLDHLIIFNQAHLRRVLVADRDYDNRVRTHLSLAKDAPHGRPLQRIGEVTRVPYLGGLHHSFVRI
jgi:transposase InsO family protein